MRDSEADPGIHERGQRQPEGCRENRGKQHIARAPTVGNRPCNRLRQAPDKLSNRQSETKGDHAQAGRRVHRAHEQAEGLPSPHRDHQNPCGRQNDGQDAGRLEGLEH